MMKPLLIATISLFIGLGLGYVVANNTKQNKTEEIVKAEVSLLSKYMETPSCDELANGGTGLNQAMINGDYVIWRYFKETKQLEKLVLSADFIFVYEKLNKVCGSN